MPKTTAANPGQVLLAGHACLLGALEATHKVASSLLDASEAPVDWSEEFSASSQRHALAMSPLGGELVKRAVERE